MNRLVPEDSGKVIRFIVIFYIVGFTGFALPFTQDVFTLLTKWALLLNLFLLLWFHREPYDLKTLAVLSFISLAGLIVEMIGVNTGLIFGNYFYGGGLGIKIWNTPLLIGINWLLLAYCAASILQLIRLHAVIRILLGAAIMLVYDLVLEITAPMLDLWYWKDGVVPIDNYLAWFILALIFQSILVSFRIKLRNPLALTLLLAQFVFFMALAGYKLIQS